MGKYAGSMRTTALSGAETIHVNGEVLEYLIQGNQHCYCAVHTPQCRTYDTMPYAVCRMKYAVREHASSLISLLRRDLNECRSWVVRLSVGLFFLMLRFVCFFVCLFIYLFICLSVGLFCLFVCLFLL